MENTNKTVYIIDLYNKFSPDKVISVFQINNRWWAIKEVPLLWGVPQLSTIEENKFITYHLYNTVEEAQQYVRTIKKLEGSRF